MINERIDIAIKIMTMLTKRLLLNTQNITVQILYQNIQWFCVKHVKKDYIFIVIDTFIESFIMLYNG